MSSLELIWLTTATRPPASPGIPMWTVSSASAALTTRAAVALAGFSVSSQTAIPIQNLEIRTVIRHFSNTPGSTTWASVEILPRLETGWDAVVSVGAFQATLLLVHSDGSDSLTAGTASVVPGGPAASVPLDSSSTTNALGLLTGFGLSYGDAAHNIAAISVTGVTATPVIGKDSSTVTLAGTTKASDASGNTAQGTTDVAFVAWAPGAGVYFQPLPIGTADLLANAPQKVTFSGLTSVGNAAVAIIGFSFSRSSGDSKINQLSVQISNLAWSNDKNQVTFNASATIGDLDVTAAASYALSLQLAVFATP